MESTKTQIPRYFEIIELKRLAVDKQMYEQAARLRDEEKQILTNLGYPFEITGYDRPGLDFEMEWVSYYRLDRIDEILGNPKRVSRLLENYNRDNKSE